MIQNKTNFKDGNNNDNKLTVIAGDKEPEKRIGTIDRIDEVMKIFYPNNPKINNLIFGIDNIQHFVRQFKKYINSDSKSIILKLFCTIDESSNLLHVNKKILDISRLRIYVRKLYDIMYHETQTTQQIYLIQNYAIHVAELLEDFIIDWLFIFNKKSNYKIESNINKSIEYQNISYIFKLIDRLPNKYKKCLNKTKYCEKMLNKYIDFVMIDIRNREKFTEIPKDLIDFLPKNVTIGDYIKRYFDERVRPNIKITADVVVNIFNLFIQLIEFGSIN